MSRPKYPGRDLEAMSFAPRYHRWILEIFAPYLNGSVVEVGAGSGLFSELLAETSNASLILVEPSDEMFPLLKAKFADRPHTELHQDFFINIAEHLTPRPDAIVYVNVLEHIRDDDAELQAVFAALKPGGHLLLFVPALRWLYGALDKEIDHFRRYHLKALTAQCSSHGFEIVRSRYFDLLGILPWWINFKLLKSKRINPKAVLLYDKLAVPVGKALESRIRPPIGKNIVLIARKPA